MNNKIYLAVALAAIGTIAAGYGIAAALEYEFGAELYTAGEPNARVYEFGDERGLNAPALTGAPAQTGAQGSAHAQLGALARLLAVSVTVYAVFLAVLVSGAGIFIYVFWRMFSANCPGNIDRSGYEEI